MVLGKRWLYSIGYGAEIRPLEKGRKALTSLTKGVRVVPHCILTSLWQRLCVNSLH